MSSNLFKRTIKTSESHSQAVIITTQQIDADVNGNPRHKIQVWVDREENGSNLWTPFVKCYRLLKDDSYTIQSYNIKMDIEYFIMAFESSIQS